MAVAKCVAITLRVCDHEVELREGTLVWREPYDVHYILDQGELQSVETENKPVEITLEFAENDAVQDLIEKHCPGDVFLIFRQPDRVDEVSFYEFKPYSVTNHVLTGQCEIITWTYGVRHAP